MTYWENYRGRAWILMTDYVYIYYTPKYFYNDELRYDILNLYLKFWRMGIQYWLNFHLRENNIAAVNSRQQYYFLQLMGWSLLSLKLMNENLDWSKSASNLGNFSFIFE